MPEPRETLLITGAGSGLGLASTLWLAARKYRVFGAVLTDAEAGRLRREAQQRGLPVDILQMDVTRRSDIERAVDSLMRAAGRLDGVIQFAGLGLRGFFEDLTLEEVKNVFEVNVFGVMSVTQCVLPHMRKARRGRLILTSSSAGRTGSMSISGYSATKFAGEGFAECLAQEVRPFNIYVSLLEPGLIDTPHFGINRNRARRAVDPASPYYLWFCQHEKIVDDILASHRFSPDDVARQVHKILQARRPRLRYIVGPGARIIINLRRYIPGEWFERAYWAVLRRKVTRPRVQVTSLSSSAFEPRHEKATADSAR